MALDRVRVLTGGLALAACCVAPVVRAQAVEESAAVDQAHQAFERGMALVRLGDFDGAIAEFQRAYAAKANYAVLFNLGQAFARVGRPVEAVRALEGYLREGGPDISAKRKAAVETLIREQARRLGSLLITNRSPSVEISIDGGPVLDAAATGAISVAAGTHAVVAKRADGALFAESVQIAPGQVKSLELRFAARDSTESAPRPVHSAPRLEVQTWPKAALVRVDGVAYSGGALTPGPHRVEVTRPGFMSFRDVLRLEPGPPQRLTVALSATPTPPPVWNRTPWIVAGGISAAMLGALAVSLYSWNESRYAEWQRDRRAVDARVALGPEDMSQYRQRLSLYDRAQSIQTVDAVIVSSALLGASALVSSGILWLTRSPSERR